MTSDDLAPRIIELLALARAHHAAGHYREALTAAREVLGVLDGPRALPWCIAAATAAECLVQLGDGIGARDEVRHGRELSEGTGDILSRLLLDTAEADALTDAGRAVDAIQLLEPAVRVGREHGDAHHSDSGGAPNVRSALSRALTILGGAYAGAGRHSDALSVSEEALAVIEGTAEAVDRSRPHITIALAALGLGDVERAEAAYAAAVDLAQTLEERGNEGWAHFAGGAIALHRGDRATTQQRLDEAQEIAEELGMMRLVERCRAALRRAR
jgi:tetratricopeptide (TPR) repeat protein